LCKCLIHNGIKCVGAHFPLDRPEAIHLKMLEDRAQSLSLRKKLERVGTSISTIENSLQGLSTTRLKLDPSIPKSGIEQAAQNILSSIWLLLSSLQLLIRELV
jgi:hypothetical protein